MHEVNGFALLNEAEAALVLGRGSSGPPGGADIIRVAPPSLSRSGLEALCRGADLVCGQAQRAARNPELGDLLAERFARVQAAQEARSDSAACLATALALRDPRWQSNPEVLARLARVTDGLGRPCASEPEPDTGEVAIQSGRIPSFGAFVASVHQNLANEQRGVLANLYEGLAEAYQSRSDALCRYGEALGAANAARERADPWLAKGYYRPMMDSRQRILADAQGRIFFEHVNPAAPTRWARNTVKGVALACGNREEDADRLAERFHFLDIVGGEIRGGTQSVASHFSHVLASRKVTDPYARAFAIAFWSVKDFLDSRTGNYPEVAQGSALREAAGKAAALLDLPRQRAWVEEELKKAELRANAQERQMEAILSKSGWSRSSGERAPVAQFRRGGDRGR
ncbi:MAG: hypothetical protein PHP75_00745 [Methylacidiphilaceae bacterium]|nr:hypothetical protein [Candidatus Methylacidiphilaceae bacterium]